MRIFLAPMEGVVDHHVRYLLTAIGGIDMCVTEFVRITNHTLPRKVFIKYCPELVTHTAPHERESRHGLSSTPTRVQLLGCNPKALASNAAKAASLGAVGIDLNFGCPAKTVNRNRGGACLLDETSLLAEIVSAVRAAVPPDIPVSAKIRLGNNARDSYLNNAIAIAEAGADELTVHARSKADAYRPPAYWSYLREINEALNIPVIANGEIWSVEDFILCKEQSQCSDFMLGRGILSRPDLACAIKAEAEGRPYESLGWQQVSRLLYDYHLATLSLYPIKFAGNRIKQWLHYLQRNYPQAADLFEQIKRERDSEVLSKALRDSASSALQRDAMS